MSPDGRRVAFLANAATGKSQLWVRALDTLAAQELPGTDGASTPFWSPDSRFLGFYTDGKLKKIDVTGGPPTPLCDSPSWRGATWSRDGVIVFSPGSTSGLLRVSDKGGVPAAATVLEKGETGNARPAFLPDGRHFLYYEYGAATLYVASLDSPERKLVPKDPGNSNVRYAQGHLLFLRDQTLMAQPFDVRRLALMGEPVPVAEQIATTGGPPVAAFSASDTGVLVYQTGTAPTRDTRQLAWFDRTGKLLETLGEPGDLRAFHLSPNGQSVAVSIFLEPAAQPTPQRAAQPTPQTAPQPAPRRSDVWTLDVMRGLRARFTFAPENENYSPVWSPDGRSIVFASSRQGHRDLYRKAVDGPVGSEELLYADDLDKAPGSWSSDGRYLLYAATSPKTKSDIWVLPMTGEKKPFVFPLAGTEFTEIQGAFSPNGQWIAYVSNESGLAEVYAAPFPPRPGGKTQISGRLGSSPGQGGVPNWRPDGKAIFFIAPNRDLMTVDVNTTGPILEPGPARKVFGPILTVGGHNYDIAPDGRFLTYIAPPERPREPLTLVQNWTAALKK